MGLKTLPAKIGPGEDLVLMHFVHFEHEIVFVFMHQIPGVTGLLALHIFEKVRGAKEMEFFISTQKQAQEGVESNEMVHVCVRDKDMVYLEEVPCRKPPQIPQIKHQGPFFKEKGYEKAGI